MGMSPNIKLRLLRIGWVISISFHLWCLLWIYEVVQTQAAAIVILDQLGPGHRAYVIFIFCTPLAVALSLWLRHQILISRQQRNDSFAARLLNDLRANRSIPCKQFYVYLRSFETTGHLRPPFFFTILVWERLHTNELESFLALALEKSGPLVALGLPGENMGAARIRVEDATWKEDVERLLTHATGLLVIPSAHQGTMWEIEDLKRNNLLTKSVFIMPPRTKQFDWSVKWEQAARALAPIGITLPRYQEHGLLFSLNAQGQVVDARTFSLMYRRSIRRSIQKLLAGPKNVQSGEQAIKKANRTNTTWSAGWSMMSIPLVMVSWSLWLILAAMASGNAPQGVRETPTWSTFFRRLDSASEANPSDLQPYKIFGHKWSESEIDQLAWRGLLQIDDREREQFLIGFGHLLKASFLDSSGQHWDGQRPGGWKLCESLARFRASDLARIRTLVKLDSDQVEIWMFMRSDAAEAVLNNKPVLAKYFVTEPGLFEAVSKTFNPPDDRLRGILTSDRKLSDEEACQADVFGGMALQELNEPQKAQLAILLAKRMR
jgi:hypothetical protein